ncbi:Component of a membrane-bound complex containing the Tor2p kinase [Umbelopsis sp. WA50703]
MSLITDPNYLVHQMRIKFLRTDERGERLISFSPNVMSNDYIRTAAPIYPEMHLCYSPVYDNPMLMGTGNLISSPRTIRTGLRTRKKDMPPPSNPTTAQPATITAAVDDTKASVDSTEDYETEENEMIGRKELLSGEGQQKRASAKRFFAPAVLVTGTSQASTVRKQRQSIDSITPAVSSADIAANNQVLSPDIDNVTSEEGSNMVFSTSLMEPSIYSPMDTSLNSSGDLVQKSSEMNGRRNPTDITMKKSRRRSTLGGQQPPVNIAQQIVTFPATEDKASSLVLPVTEDSAPLVYERQCLPVRPTFATRTSTLTAMIEEKGKAAENPFADDYSFVSGKGESSPTTLCVYLPFSSTPDEPVNVVVRSDALVEEVIGFLLYQYIEQKKTPKLEPDMCNVVRWVLRIAEEDGEIEEDLPAVDRARRINRISFDQFALCEATPSQVKQNEQTHAKLAKNKPKKEPSTLPFAPSAPAPDITKNIEQQAVTVDQPVPANIQQSAPALTDGLDNTNLKPTGPVSAPANEHISSADVAVPVPSQKNMLTKSTMTMAPTQHFRIRLMTNEEVSATTTLPVHAQMFMGDVLELVCRKRKLDTNEYILTFADYNMIVPNDTTVESLSGIIDLCLVKKSAAAASHMWRSPSKKKKEDLYPAGLFSPNTSNPSTNESSMSSYKRYTVNRKMPMFVGKRESVLAIDGDYVHIMPPEKIGMFDSVKTTSFHVSQVLSCKQSKKAPSNFKIVVIKERDHDHKTYELEAESAKDARKLIINTSGLFASTSQ